MVNIQLLDENQYFVESKKAIQAVLEAESLLDKQLKMGDKLQLVKEHKGKTNSLEEFEELEKLEKELERKIRFKQFTVPAIPEEHRAKVKRNAAVEQLEVDNKLNELKDELKERIAYLENDLLPLIANIKMLEEMKSIPMQIDAVLDCPIGEGAPYPARYVLNRVTRSKNGLRSTKAVRDLQKVIKSLKEIEVPIKTKGLLDFLKRGKK